MDKSESILGTEYYTRVRKWKRLEYFREYMDITRGGGGVFKGNGYGNKESEVFQGLFEYYTMVGEWISQ